MESSQTETVLSGEVEAIGAHESTERHRAPRRPRQLKRHRGPAHRGDWPSVRRYAYAYSMSTTISPLAGKPAPASSLVDVSKLLAAYGGLQPDAAVPAQRVAFGTSGHRGSSFERSFNEWHVLTIAQAICDYRHKQGIDGPLYLGIDTHALSQPAFQSALEVLAANGVETMIASGGEFTPTPAVSHAILGYNRGRSTGLADGIVITPSHNPPDNGGIKYNPPNGGPADTEITNGIETRANGLLADALKGVRRMPAITRGRAAATTPRTRLSWSRYVSDLGNVIDFDAIRGAGLHMGVDPLGGAGSALLGADCAALQARPHRGQRGSRSHVPLHDAGLGRQGFGWIHLPPMAMQRLVGLKGSVRRRLCLRYGPRPSRHRHPRQRAASAESLPVSVDRLFIPASAAMEPGRRGWQDSGQYRAD